MAPSGMMAEAVVVFDLAESLNSGVAWRGWVELGVFLMPERRVHTHVIYIPRKNSEYEIPKPLTIFSSVSKPKLRLPFSMSAR